MQETSNAIKLYVDSQGADAMKKLETALDSRLEATSAWAQGRRGRERLGDAARGGAADTACQIRADRYLDEKSDLEKMAKQYDDIASVFQKPTKEALKTRVKEFAGCLAQSYIEGLVCVLFQSSEYSKEEKKNNIHG
eukprot:4341553-Pyramimonas_sp.AAC.1